MTESTIDDVHEEEDWSGIIGDISAGSFAQHDTLEICLPNGKPLQIASTACLSPLDMLDLGWGTCDATGHRVWLGAKLWIQALPTLAPFFLSSTPSCRCLELGSGTGLAGLAALHYFYHEISFDLILTDNSESVLELCRANCQRNNLDGDATSTARVKNLEWGSLLPGTEGKQDIVMATDVIYDLVSWKPLLETARRSLSLDGYLVVAHVPRAALPEEFRDKGSTTTSYHKSLESYLIRISLEYGFRLRLFLRPMDLDTFPGQHDMEEAGASILVFERDTGES
jgi:SAM-dependent methyltransferase